MPRCVGGGGLTARGSEDASLSTACPERLPGLFWLAGVSGCRCRANLLGTDARWRLERSRGKAWCAHCFVSGGAGSSTCLCACAITSSVLRLRVDGRRLRAAHLRTLASACAGARRRRAAEARLRMSCRSMLCACMCLYVRVLAHMALHSRTSLARGRFGSDRAAGHPILSSSRATAAGACKEDPWVCPGCSLC